eukprot:scaffold934_cov191-Alexandrium_tamarense.AAC.27
MSTSYEEEPRPSFNDISDDIVFEVYAFLHPQDLLYLSLANRHSHKEITRRVLQIARLQLPRQLENADSIGMDYVIAFSEEFMFRSREGVIEHVLKKAETAELRLVGVPNVEESILEARRVLKKRSGVTLVTSPTDRFQDPEYINVGCHFQHVQEDKELAMKRANDIVARIQSTEELADNARLIKAWMYFILSQRRITAGSWFWSCRHPSLDFQGVEAKGVMISSNGEELEITWTRMTASKVGPVVQVEEIVPQFAIATEVVELEAEPIMLGEDAVFVLPQNFDEHDT